MPLPNNMMLLLIIIVVVAVVSIVLMIWFWHVKEKEILEGVYGGCFIPVDEFEENWIVGGSRGRSGFTGYKYEDGPGCYVILIFSHEVEGDAWDDFDEVYIGQSVNMCARVHAHFNGKGNGDVYADVRNGKYVYVQFVPCKQEDMNDIEKSLIGAFNATDSYNRTRGGSVYR